MTRLVRWLQLYLLGTFPLILIVIVWGQLSATDPGLDTNVFRRLLWDAMSWNLMLWYGSLIALLALLIGSAAAREQTISALAGALPRDERETQIIGQAARQTFISTLALLIGLLFLSIFCISIDAPTPEQAAAGVHGVLGIGVNISIFNEKGVNKPVTALQSFSFSPMTLLLLVTCWLLVSFRYYARREHAKVS